MKRWLLAIAVFLGIPVGYASADYIVIVANLGEQRGFRTNPGGNMNGNFGQIGGMPGGIGGMPGGIGGRPGGIGQIGAIGGMPGGIGGMPGGMGGRPGGGIGGRLGGLGQIGAIGQIGGQLGQIGGQLGQIGGVNGGVPGGPNTPPKPEDIQIDPDAVPLYVTAIVEIRPLTDLEMKLFTLKGKAAIVHKYCNQGGNTIVLAYDEGERFQYRSTIIRDADGKPLPPVSGRYEKKHQKVFDGTEKPKAEDILDLADWALQHGLLNKFTEVMDELAKQDKTNPIVVAYLKVKENLEKPLPEPHESNVELSMQKEFKLKRTAREHDHYVIYHQSATDNAVEVQTRLDRLEANFRNFYYWFALKGIVLPMPKERLTTVLTSHEKDFNELHKVTASSPVVVDGFLNRRDNAAVFSAKRLDEGYDALEKLSNPIWEKGLNKNDILRATPRIAPRDMTLEGVYEAQTLALLLKTMEFDGERAAISHDGARQMIYASGLLPKNVIAPEWVQYGVGSFFETPLGSPWTTTGAPSIEHLPNFRDYRKLNRLEKTPGQTLTKVVTDGYFRDASIKLPATERRARATSWALTYFLMQMYPEKMLRYYKELSKQPRDVELDPPTLLACFARAFDLLNADKTVDQRKVDALASLWYDRMDNARLDMEDEVTKIRTFIAESTKGKEKTDNLQIDPTTGLPVAPPGGSTNPGRPGGGRPPIGPGGRPPGGGTLPPRGPGGPP